MMRQVAVILAGGSGERFWPLSRQKKPKQMLRLGASGATLLEEAIARAAAIVGPNDIYLATGQPLSSHLRDAGVELAANLIEEPEPRNTFGAILWAIASLVASPNPIDEDTVIAVLTADHRITPIERFASVAKRAIALASAEKVLVTIGIRPTRPEPGFGHILGAASTLDSKSPKARRISSFIEKPDGNRLARLMEDPSLLWNSGMFFWSLATFRSALATDLPEVVEIFDAVVTAIRTGDLVAAKKAFQLVPRTPIDVALAERADNAIVVEADFEWEDVGSVNALYKLLERDENGNATVGKSLLLDCKDVVVYGEASERLVCALGIEGLAVVVTGDAILIIPTERAQEVRKIVDALKEKAPELL